MNRQTKAEGFTLIEMMVSMMLLSFITVIGYQGLMFSARQWNLGHKEMTFQYDHHQAVNWVREKIGSSEKVRNPASSDYAYLFTGQKGSVEFVSRHSRVRKGGLYVNRVIYDEKDQSLSVIYYLYHPDIDIQDSPPERVSILSDVRSIEFSYYGSKKGDAAKWYNNWVDLNSLPQLLRLDIKNGNGDFYQSTIHLITSNNA